MKLTKEEFKRVEEQEPLELFKQGIRADATKEKYTRTLKMIVMKVLDGFFEGDFEQRVKQLIKTAKEDPIWARDLLLNISKKLKERTDLPQEDRDYLNPSSFDNYFKPLKKLFEMNDVVISWKRIYATFPEVINDVDGRGWTRQEIQEMLKFSSGIMDRTIVLVAASSGIRSGSFDICWEDIDPVYILDNKLTTEITESQVEEAEIVCAMLRIYKGSSEQYPAFITPEAYVALQDWTKEWALQVGREPKPKEPVFKREGDLPIKATTASIKKRVERMVQKGTLRPPLLKGKRRHQVPIMNGFRRFWNKTFKESLSRDSPVAAFIKKEYMMGHQGLFKLDKNYFKTQFLELAEEYLNAVPDLTISNEFRLRVENRKLIHEKNLITDEIISTQARFDAKLDELFKNQETNDEIIKELVELGSEEE